MSLYESTRALAVTAFLLGATLSPAVAGTGSDPASDWNAFWCSLGFSLACAVPHGGGTPGTPVANVPEINASSGLAALAAVSAAFAFAWERRRGA